MGFDDIGYDMGLKWEDLEFWLIFKGGLEVKI